jgi:hypothetical protein
MELWLYSSDKLVEMPSALIEFLVVIGGDANFSFLLFLVHLKKYLLIFYLGTVVGNLNTPEKMELLKIRLALVVQSLTIVL